MRRNYSFELYHESRLLYASNNEKGLAAALLVYRSIYPKITVVNNLKPVPKQILQRLHYATKT